jgi:DNA helicase HerA-like ATPase
VNAETYVPNKEAIGHFPGTNFSVEIESNLAVTHNTAILGVLGSGKSFLALELVERLIVEGIKVVALDLTNQYAQELKRYYDDAVEQPKLDKLKQMGAAGKANVHKNVEEGGSVVLFAKAIKEDLKEFLSAGAVFLKIYNPAAFEVWKQDSKPFQDKASMASLTPTEVTRIITESLLELLRDKMSDTARACIVFEEAHSLVPEWNAVASEGDKTATNGTAKAILQGRKYGLGCIVVTQRTANVTKSILNQCNTVFALRVFDATGMEFLKNYIGEDYASVLSSLEDRHAVVFGRGSRCRSPVLLRLNDREEFLKTFRPAEE